MSSSRATVRSSKGSLRPSRELLPLLVALAGDHDDIVGHRERERLFDRRAAIDLDVDRSVGERRGRDAGDDLGDDLGGLLRAGVVGCDERDVRQARGDRPHQRTLAAIAVSPGPEHADDAPASDVARGAQHVLERVGRVGVVDEHREVLSGVDRLEAPGHPDAALQGCDERVEVEAERMHGRERAEGVGDVEAAGHRERDLALAGRRVQGEATAGEVATQVRGAVVGGRVEGERPRVLDLAREPPPVGVADVDDADSRRRALAGQEQQALGEEVVLHARMEVEVVLRQVREHGRGEANPAGAPELERVRGDLHRAGAIPAVEHRAEARVQVDRLGGRALDWTLLAADDRRDRAQQAGLLVRRLQQRAHEERGRRLAVRAGDPDDAQRRARIAVKPACNRPHRRAHGGNQDLGHAEAQWSLHDKRPGAVRDRLRGEVVPVAAEARNAEEQRAGLHSATVVREPRDLDVRAVTAHGTDARDQLAKRHRSNPSDSTPLV